MAGDKKGEQRKEISRYGQPAMLDMDDLRTQTLVPQNQQFWNNYQNATGQAQQDYGSIMGQYQDFAKTGGFSPLDTANMRARAVSPIRAAYANASRNVDRQRTLQGGYSPGYGTLQGRLARESSSAMSDASTNVEGMLAQMKQQGRLAGLGGASNLYGTTPGMANMYGNQVLASTQQRLQGQGLQNQMALGMIGAHQNAQALPGKWEGTMGRIGDVIGLGQQVGGIIYPWMNPGAGSAGGLNPNYPGIGNMPAPPSVFKGY